MFNGEIVAVCFENPTEHANTFSRQDAYVLILNLVVRAQDVKSLISSIVG